MGKLTHVDAEGRVRMVGVSGKGATKRHARACGRIAMSPDTLGKIREGRLEKGAVLAVARVAAIGATKRTADIVPLCHPIGIDGVEVEFRLLEAECAVECEVAVFAEAKTGPEMEAIMGVAGALVAIYDMCKAVDRTMEISGIRLLEKGGGKSGDWRAPDQS